MKKTSGGSYKKKREERKNSLRVKLLHASQNMGVPVLVFLCVLVFYPMTRNANLVKELLWVAFLPLVFGACLFLADDSRRDFTYRALSRTRRHIKPLAFFIGALFLFNLYQRQRSVDPFWSAVTLVRLVSYIFTFFVLVILLQKIKTRYFFMEFLAFSSALCSCYMIAEYFGWDFLKWKTMDRPPGTFANPNFSADFLATTLPLVFFWEIMAKTAISRRFSKRRRLVSKGFSFLRRIPYRSVLMLIAILMSQSRSGFVLLASGAVTAAALLFFLREKFPAGNSPIKAGKNFPHRWFVLSGLCGILIIEIFVGVVFWLVPEKLSHVFNATTVQIRLRLWEGCLILIRERPILGWGLGSFGTVSQKINYLVEPIVGQKQAFHAHNWFLELLVEQGIVGVPFFLGFPGYMFFLFLKALRRRLSRCDKLLLVGVMSGVVGLLSGMLFDVWLNWWGGGWILWVLLGFGAAISMRTLSGELRVSSNAKSSSGRAKNLFRLTGGVLILLSVCLFILNLMIFRSEKFLWRYYNLIQASQYEKAMKILKGSSIRIFPSPSMQFWKAAGLYHSKKYQEAETILSGLMEKHPAAARYPMMLGYAMNQRKKPDQAETLILKAYGLEPNGENALKLSRFLISQNKPEEAMRIMERQLQKALYPPLLHFYLKFEKEQGRSKEARSFLSQLRDNLPFLKRKTRGELARWEAELSSLLNDMGWAKKAYRLSLLYDPDNYQVWNDLGLVLKNLGYYERADKAFSRSIKLKNDNFVPIFNRLELALGRRDFSLAKRLIEKLKTMNIPEAAEKRLRDIETNLP